MSIGCSGIVDYDADWSREALKDKGIRACIPGRKQWKKPVKYDNRRYKRRNRIEIMFGRLKDWLRVATRYDGCPKVFLSAIVLAALVIYWLWVLTLAHADKASEPVKAGIINFFISVLLSMSTYSEKRYWLLIFCQTVFRRRH